MRRKFLTMLALGLAAAAWGQSASAQSSGMLLGVRVTEPQGPGLYVQSTIPGYSADGILRRGDIVLRATDGNQIYRTDTLRQIEFAKTRIGAMVPAEVEVSRLIGNGRRIEYFRVTFQPVGGVVRSTTATGEVRTRSVGTPPGSKKGDYTAEFEKSTGQLFKKAETSAGQRSSPGTSGTTTGSGKGSLFQKAEGN